MVILLSSPMSWRKTTIEEITAPKPWVANGDSTRDSNNDRWHDGIEDLDLPNDDNTELDLTDYQVWLAHKLTSIHRFVLHHQNQVASRMKSRADAKRREPGLQTNDLVMVSAKVYPGKEPYCKHAPRFYGPFVLGETRGPNAFEVKGLPGSMHPTINVSYLKKFIPLTSSISASDATPTQPTYLRIR